MLIHITPKFYHAHRRDLAVKLVDLRVTELGIELAGDRDLVARCPYPNKHYLVGCRKVGQKAVSGILLQTSFHVPHYTVTTRWAIGADRLAVHVVRYEVLDEEFDCITDEMTCWYASGQHDWPSRWPVQDLPHKAPCYAAPRMALKDDSRSTSEFPQVKDTWSDGWLVRREETFQLHTIALERFCHDGSNKRFPQLQDAFQVTGNACAA
ncbi:MULTISPECIES: DUF6012 family protein [Xanthomonas]|uniref:DUF6012 family protein n=1 Tax=Xanthomonas TaxID=338 RepID=UPI00062B3921|nr:MULTISPECIES: DUF6012 family protein [Xanthomonas]KKY04216.1 hypothetical protein NY94_24075 [Xanthomonas phaseoli pv. phaseoli]KKY07922.1 hypothetical protein NB99_23655 [Xanthomonas citri pv. fuscans]